MTSASLLPCRGVLRPDRADARTPTVAGTSASVPASSDRPSSGTSIAARPRLVMISASARPSSSRLQTGMPGFALTSRTSPCSISVAASFWAAFSFLPSGTAAAPSWRCAARDSTTSCVSVSLIERSSRVADLRRGELRHVRLLAVEPGQYRPVTTTTPLQLKGRRGPKARGTIGRRVVTQHIALAGSEVHSILRPTDNFRWPRGSARGSSAFARDH